MTDTKLADISYRYDHISSLLTQLRDLSDLDGNTSEYLERTLVSVATELREAKNARFLEELSRVVSKISEVSQTSESVKYADYTERLELLDQIARAIKLYTSADIVILYEMSSGGRLRSNPGTAGDFRNFEAMKTDVRPTDVVYQFLKKDPQATDLQPIYVTDSQIDVRLTASNASDPDRMHERFVFREAIISTVIIPITYQNQIEGLLFLNYRKRQSFPVEQKAEYERLSREVGNTIHNIRIHRRAVEHNHQLETLLNVVQMITHTASREEILTSIIEGAVKVLGTSRGAIVEWDSETSTGKILVEYRVDKSLPSYVGRVLTNDIFTTTEVLNGRQVVINNVDEFDALHDDERRELQQGKIKSTLIVPIKDAKTGKVFASIGVDETRFYKAFSKSDIRLCEILANQTEIALKLGEAFRDLTVANDVMQLQQQVMDASIENDDPDTALNELLEKGLALLPKATTGQLLLINNGQELVTIVSTNKEEVGLPYDVNNSVTGQAVNERKTIRVGNVEDLPHYQPGYEHNMLSELAVPLIDDKKKKVIGVLNAESSELDAFTEEDQKIWEVLAQRVVKLIDLTQLLAQQKAHRVLTGTQRRLIQSAGINREEVLQSILDHGKDLANASIGQILILDGDFLKILVSTEPDDQGKEFHINNSITGLTIRRNAAVNIKNLDQEIDPENGEPYRKLHQWWAQDKKMTSELAVPLRFGDDTIGVINFESIKEHAFTDLHEGLITSLATQAAMLIKLTQLFELQKQNKELELSQAQSRDTADILHRINNPLGLIQQYASFALERLDELKIDDSILRSDLEKALVKGTEIANLVRKLRSDLRDLEAYSLDINQQLQLALEEYKEYKEVNSLLDHITFIPQIEDNLPTVRCGSKLRRVFFDLIKNAVEAIGSNEGVVTICAQHNHRGVEVTISDTGSGIPAEILEHIFEDWFFTYKADSGTHLGRGLGLYWARKFLTAYKAEITAESKFGEGTTMRVIFPA